MKQCRKIAHIVIEAETPLAVGSGEKGLTVDRLIARDHFGLPYIPGTSLAGILRHQFEASNALSRNYLDFFGYGNMKKEDKEKLNIPSDDKGKGALLKYTSAHLLNSDGSVIEGLQNIDFEDGYLQHFSKLPNRDHAKINHKGAADTKGHGKFDEEVVFKGTRFAFEIELEANDDEQESSVWNELLSLLNKPFLRIGGGTRKGFGEIKVIKELSKTKTFDLTNSDDLKAYLDADNSLNKNLDNWNKIEDDDVKDDNYIHYQLKLKPESFFTFSAGYGDTEVDSIPKFEAYFVWDEENKNPDLKDFTPENNQLGKALIPASSIKGAISHRVAYHFNKLMGVYADEMSEDSFESETGNNNKAVQELFGFIDIENNTAKRGKVIIPDKYIDYSEEDIHIFNHVAIDRFTGGGMDGALFSEKVISTDKEIELDIFVEKSALENENIIKAFKNTLDDLVNGFLPLGGMTTKGNGVFKGSYELKNN